MTKYLRDNPLLLKEWDYSKNKGIDIETISSGKEQYVWWKCSVCGNEWKAMIYSRFNGHGCPKCGLAKRARNRKMNNIKKNGSLSDNYKELIKEWDYAKNDIKPEECSPNTNKKVWWKCEKGHAWEASIAKRTLSRRNCPFCSNQKIKKGYNDLKTINKELAKEWSHNKNNINPTEVGANSSKKVWWKCSICNYEWEATIVSRNAGNGCPVCANKIIIKGYNDFETINKNVMSYWDYEKNDIKPDSIAPGYNKKIWWKCPKCDYKWYGVTPRATREDTICPNCYSEFRVSFSEKAVAFYIKKIDNTIIENYKPKYLNGKELDIYIPSKKIAIEYDGVYYHKNTKRDIDKDIICSNNNIELYRIRELGCPDLNSSSICIKRTDDNNKSLNEAIKILINNIYDIKADIDVERDNSFINELIKYNNKNLSLSEVHPELVKEWDYEKNDSLKPEHLKSSSGRKVWWKCSKCGNSWKAVIASRSNGNGCPFCSNRIIKTGFNDLNTICPPVAKEWNYDKNNKVTPYNIGAGTAKKVWWKCSTCNYEWEASVNSRVRGNGCPNCAKLNKKVKHYM